MHGNKIKKLKTFVTGHEGANFAFYIYICVIQLISLIHPCGMSYCMKFLFLFIQHFSVKD